MTTTFDTITTAVAAVLQQFQAFAQACGDIIVNRDLYGRVRLILADSRADEVTRHVDFKSFSETLETRLGAHAPASGTLFLFEEDLDEVVGASPSYRPETHPTLRIVDRLATETDWAHIANESTGTPRVVFYSIKGGVGRSTAIAVVATVLAERGRRVMVVDLDLASPGLSNGLLPPARHPKFGVVDWLVEDLVDAGGGVADAMVGVSALQSDGALLVVPAHGREPGEYIAKLGRVWMPKMGAGGPEPWAKRLDRMLRELEDAWRPDVVLVDARSGIDEIASACVTELGATMVLLFGNDSRQTWEGYRVLFEHWRRAGVMRYIRDQLQCVGAVVQVDDLAAYVTGLRENAWGLFVEHVYDAVGPGETVDDQFSFDCNDHDAPHAPWQIRWHPAFSALGSWQDTFGRIDARDFQSAFGDVIDGIAAIADATGVDDV